MTLIEAIQANNEKVFFELLSLRINTLGKRIIDEVDAECAGNALYWAVACGHLHFIGPLIKAGANVNKPNNLGWTPVYAAAHFGYAEIVTALKTAGADVNAADDSGTTPVCAAAYNGHTKAIIALKAAGADVEATEVNGLTPLYIAVQMGDVAVINALLEAGANANAGTPQGTPLELAKQVTAQQDIVRMLETHLQRYHDGIKPQAIKRRNSEKISFTEKKEEQEETLYVLDRLKKLFLEERDEGEKTENYHVYNKYLKIAFQNAELVYKEKQNKHVLYLDERLLSAEVAGEEISKMIKFLQKPKKEVQALAQLKASYLGAEYAITPDVFLKLEERYIDLQMLRCVGLSGEAQNDDYMRSAEDLFGEKYGIKIENLFKPTRELFDEQVSRMVKDADESPRLLLIQYDDLIDSTTFVHYVAHQWSKGQLYTNYTWVFSLVLPKLYLLPNIQELSLSEWIRQSQFANWEQKEFDELWKQHIEPAINQNKVLLILDGYNEIPKHHPCQSVIKNLLASNGRYFNLSLLMTTRASAVQDITEKRRTVEIIKFTDKNINQYIEAYFLKFPDKTLVHNLINTLRKQPIIWANMHIPFNLKLLCSVVEETIQQANIEDLNQELTQLSSMTRLYQVMEKELYKRFYRQQDTHRSTNRRMATAPIDFIKYYQKERLFLAELAFQNFQAERIIIPMREIRASLQAYIEEMPQNVLQEKADEALLKTVCELGVINSLLGKSSFSQIGQDYRFLHLTFQEYYTAIYLAEGLSSKESATKVLVEKLILREKYNPRWQIVWWFVAGLLRENTPVYECYLQQLQSQCRGQILEEDILQHYQLGLLTRCVDEGFKPENQQAIEPIVKQLQLGFFNLYRATKNIINNDESAIKDLALIKSPFFFACRISPGFCMNGKQDLYVLIPEPIQSNDKHFLLRWIDATRIVTPKLLDVLVTLFTDQDGYALQAERRFDKPVSMCSSALSVLGKLGVVAVTPKILDTLLELLENKDCHVCSSAAYAVGELGAAAATPKILDALLRLLVREEDSIYDHWFASPFGEMDDDCDIFKRRPAQLIYLHHKDCPRNLDAHDAYGDRFVHARVPNSAIEAFAKLGAMAATPKVLGTLLGLLADKDSKVKAFAAYVVGKLGAAAAVPKVIDALLELLAGESMVGHSAAYAIGNLSTIEVMPQLLGELPRLLASQESESGACLVVGNLGVAAATPEVLDALALVGYSAYLAYVLIKLGEVAATPKMLDRLAKWLALKIINFDGFNYAACVVGKLGAVAATPEILDTLAGLLVDEDPYVFASAAKAVSKLGRAAAIPKILDALMRLPSEQQWLRLHGRLDQEVGIKCAEEAIAKLDAAALMPKGLDTFLLLVHRRCDVHGYVQEVIDKLGAAAATRALLDTLLGLLVDKDSSVRSSAVHAIGALGSAAATPKVLNALVGIFADQDIHMRFGAADTFCRLGAVAITPQLLDTVLGLLKEKDGSMRYCAVRAIRALGTAAVTPKLLDTLLGLLVDEDSFVRSSAAEAVGALGAVAVTPKLLDALLGLLVDEHSLVRSSAADAVGALGAVAVTPKLLDALLGLLKEKDRFGKCVVEALTKCSKSTAMMPEFLEQLLNDYSVPDNDKALRIFGMHINSIFMLIPSFLADNANHPNLFAFTSYILAAAYLNSRISCQISFNKEGVPAGYYMRGYIEKSCYCFLITEWQAQLLCRLFPLIVEQLSEIGKLDVAQLKARLPEREGVVQSLLLSNQQYSITENRNVTIHLSGNLGSASEQNGAPVLTQYEQGSRTVSKTRINQNYRGAESTCKIS